MKRLKLFLFLNLNQNQNNIIFRCTNIANNIIFYFVTSILIFCSSYGNTR